MKKIIILALIMLLSCPFCSGQAGINTTAPKGILDVNSSTHGVVFPNVALTSKADPSPVINPQGGNLAIGTAVYNTNTTSTGSVNDVHPGVYVWNGSEWTIHFIKRQSELFEQTAEVRTVSSFPGDWQDIDGIGPDDNLSFTAKYSGQYRIIVKMNFGGGEMVDNGDVNVAAQEGTFRFTFNGTSYDVGTKSYSIYNDHVGSGVHYNNIWKESYITEYVNLTAGNTYSFYLQFDQEPADGFVNDGESGNGRGYIGTDIPCTIEITYVDE